MISTGSNAGMSASGRGGYGTGGGGKNNYRRASTEEGGPAAKRANTDGSGGNNVDISESLMSSGISLGLAWAI